MEILLRIGKLGLKATEAEKYDLVIRASTGELRFEGVKIWLENNSEKL